MGFKLHFEITRYDNSMKVFNFLSRCAGLLNDIVSEPNIAASTSATMARDNTTKGEYTASKLTTSYLFLLS
jgi:hypothetical protein